MKKIFYVLAICAVSLMVSCKGSDSKKDVAGSETEKKTKEVAPAETTTETEATAEGEDVELGAQDEAAAALLGTFEGVAEEIEKVESKEDLVAICQALGDQLKELNQKYPDFEPEGEIADSFAEASLAVGQAINNVGTGLGMTQDEINEVAKLVTFE